MKKLLLVVAALVLGFVLVLVALSSSTSVAFDPAVKVIGMDTPVQVRVTNPHGVRRVTAEIEQGGNRYAVFESTQPANRWFFFRKHEPPQVIQFTAGKKRAPALKDGKARLLVEAQGNDFRGSKEQIAADVNVNTQPPRVAVDGFQHYINQGGAELVTFTASGYWTEAGVRVGPYTFRSFPLPGRPANERFAMFALPWDVPAQTVPVVYVRNPSGAEARGHFWYKVFPKKFRTRDFPLDEGFMQRVVDQIDPNGSGDLLGRFLKINGAMRHANNRTIAELGAKTEEKVMWSGPFYRYGKTEAEFADSRNYIYKGKQVDHQTHLGFDLSDVHNSPVVAANDGRVVWADDLGIYGNCVVVDHGYGLQSVYGHMSKINVKPGDLVKKGQPMGISGATGLAGGEHVHFSMTLDGVQITPVEWWDEHWIHDRILSKLPAAAAH